MTPGLWSVLIQAIGSAATLGAAAFIAWRFGLAAQGEFGLLRSWSDALVALTALGLPQGLLHLQYREAVPREALRPFIRRYVLLVGAVAAVAVLVLAFADLSEAARAHRASVVIIVAAVPFGVGHLLWRALVLKARGVVRYSIVTGLPSILVLAGVLLLGLLHTMTGLALVILVPAAIGCAVSAAWASSTDASQSAAWPRRVLWSVSLQTWAQGALAALLVALLLSLARTLGASLTEVGVLSLGLYVYQLFAVLAAYAAPVLYDRIAAAPAEASAWLRRWRLRAISVACLALVAALIGPRAVGVAWPEAAAHAGSVTLFAVAGLSALGTRLGATVLQALGRLRELSVQAAWRLLLALGLSAALMQVAAASTAVPLALLAVEIATVLRLASLLRAAMPLPPVAPEKGAA